MEGQKQNTDPIETEHLLEAPHEGLLEAGPGAVMSGDTDNQSQQPPKELEQKTIHKRNKAIIAILIFLLAFIVVGSVSAYYYNLSKSSDNKMKQPIFVSYSRDSVKSDSSLSLIPFSDNKAKTEYTAGPYIYSDNFVIIKKDAEDSYSILYADGSIKKVNDSIIDALVNDTGGLLGSVATAIGDTSLLYTTGVKLKFADLISGKSKDLISIVAKDKNYPLVGDNITISAISKDGETAYVFIQGIDILVGNDSLDDNSLLVVDIPNESYSKVNIPNEISAMGHSKVSYDGNYIAYSKRSGPNYTKVAAYLYDIRNKTTMKLASDYDGIQGIYNYTFSPNNQYVAMTIADSTGAPGQTVIASVSTGKMIADIKTGSHDANSGILISGWKDDNNLVYLTANWGKDDKASTCDYFSKDIITKETTDIYKTTSYYQCASSILKR